MAPQQLPLTVTASAVRRIRVLRQKENKPAASLRLRIIAGGCSGMQYRMDLAEAARPTDIVVAEEDVSVFVDPKSLTYLQGSKLEWEEDLFGGQFKITNPNAKHSCSCGLSFTI
jgi:iron-sulfur cluster assembly protein